MSRYLAQFSEESDIAENARVARAVIIASSQRSGSSLLGYTLGATGQFGVPLEYFNQANQIHWKKRFGTTTVQHLLDKIEPLRTSDNGVFTIKAHYFQLGAIGSISDLLHRYQKCHFIKIHRRNLLRQAISRTIAVQTGVWISGQKPARPPQYDAHAISANLRILLRQRAQWDLAFAAAGITPLEIVYEEFLADRETQILHIAEFCELNPTDLTFPKSHPIEPQASYATSDWEPKFIKERGESSEALLNGYVPPIDAMKDLMRAVAAYARIRRGAKERWYPSPNLIHPTHFSGKP